VKYADNVLKGFATSLSIILSCLVSYSIFHDIDVSVAFMTGAGIVLLAAYMFGYQPKPVSVTANSGVKGESGESTHRKV
jgi:UDP-sugar transporter A1/2/3